MHISRYISLVIEHLINILFTGMLHMTLGIDLDSLNILAFCVRRDQLSSI